MPTFIKVKLKKSDRKMNITEYRIIAVFHLLRHSKAKEQNTSYTWIYRWFSYCTLTKVPKNHDDDKTIISCENVKEC